MSCKVNFWKRQGMQASCQGNPTTTTPATKELESKLTQMKAERLKQDTLWTTEETPSQPMNDHETNPLLQTQKPAFFQSYKKNGN